MRKSITKYYTLGILIVWAILCFAFFQFCYAYQFYYKEQTQLFVLASDYLGTYLDKPAWLACMAGDFLTQFYYYQYAGAIILTLSLLVLGDIARRSFDVCDVGKFSFWAALIVMTIEAVCHFRASFRLASTIALIGGFGLFWLYYLLKRKSETVNVILILVLTTLAYWMFGYGCFAFVLLVIAYDFKEKSRWRWSRLAVLLYIFFMAFLCRAYGWYLLPKNEILTYPGIGKVGAPNFKLERILRLDNEYYFGNMPKVIRLAQQSKDIDAETSYFFNLAQARQGTLADSLLNITQPLDQGLFIRTTPDMAMIDLYIEGELFYAWGDMTLAEHSTILANVFSPDNRNARMVKRLAEINLVNNDTTAAMKYLRILDKTLVYHRWAQQRMPGQQTKEVKAEIAEKQKYILHNDTIREPGDSRLILSSLLDANPRNTTARDYLLCSDLLRKDLGNFFADYNKYCLQRQQPCHNRLYQEALMICLAAQKATAATAAAYQLSPTIAKEFSDYTDTYTQSKGDKSVLNGRFGRTYWYYFHFASMK
jgi:hypothetical protein